MEDSRISSEEILKKLEELRESGIDLRLSDVDIDECIHRALLYDVNSSKIRPETRKIAQSCCMTCCKRLMKFFFGVVFLIWAISTFVPLHRPTERYIESMVAPHAYSIFRLVRLVGLPLRDWIDLERFYDESECVVPNPFYKKPFPGCEACQHIKSVTTVAKGELDSFLADGWFIPDQSVLLAEECLPTTVTLHHLQEAIKYNTSRPMRGISLMDVRGIDLKTIGEVFLNLTDDDMERNRKAHIEVFSSSMKASSLWRQLFPRPPLVNKGAEVAIHKSIYIDGPEASPYAVESSKGGFPYAWYVQAQGVRDLYFSTPEECRDMCITLKVRMNPMDTVFFDAMLWSIESRPRRGPTQKGDISIAYLATHNAVA